MQLHLVMFESVAEPGRGTGARRRPAVVESGKIRRALRGLP